MQVFEWNLMHVHKIWKFNEKHHTAMEKWIYWKFDKIRDLLDEIFLTLHAEMIEPNSKWYILFPTLILNHVKYLI